MAVILQVTSGPHAGRKTYLRPGQALKVGRTEWAEFTLPGDAKMADVHFSLDCGYGICRVRDLSAGLGTLVNDQPVVEADVRHGDRISAGQSTFLLNIEEAASIAPPPAAGPATGFPSGFAAIDQPTLASDVCATVKLDPPAAALLQPGLNIRKYFELLIVQRHASDAIRFLAHALPKRHAVWWGALCVRAALGETLAVKEQAAIDAAEAWTVGATDELRWAAIGLAEATNFDTPAGWVAGAAFWSGGSLTPADLPPVPPKPTLTAEAVVVAIELAAATNPAKKAPERIAKFLTLATEVADGKNRWPEKKE